MRIFLVFPQKESTKKKKKNFVYLGYKIIEFAIELILKNIEEMDFDFSHIFESLYYFYVREYSKVSKIG